jgi:hypothetical protein
MGMTPEGSPQPGEMAQVQGGLGEGPPMDAGEGAGAGAGEPMPDMPPDMEPEKSTYAMPDAKGKPIDPSELAHGIAEEQREHKLNYNEARRIALDHLREHPDYYRLVEKSLKENRTAKKYMKADGTRWADEGIEEGQKDRNWSIPANKEMGGPGGAGNGSPAAAGLSIAKQMLSRYYEESSKAQQEAFWAGDEREIVVIQDGQPMRYSRKHGQVSVEYVYKETATI